jgi:hypothetical protein
MVSPNNGPGNTTGIEGEAKKVPLRTKMGAALVGVGIGVGGMFGLAACDDAKGAHTPDTGVEVVADNDPVQQQGNDKENPSPTASPEQTANPAVIPEPKNMNPDHPGFEDMCLQAIARADELLNKYGNRSAQKIEDIFIFDDNNPDGFRIVYVDADGQRRADFN